MSPTLAAAIITRDEEQNLRELLPRLDWVDQIVVVDGGSRDETLEVAREHGCRVASRAFDDFARQRNRALALAETDWVLSIDADERPSPRLAEEVRRRIAQPRLAGYRVPIRSVIFGRPLRRSGTQDDRPVRLVRRTAAHWSGAVHEVLRVEGRLGTLDAWLSHRTQSDLDEFLAKMHRYTSLEAAARVAAGRQPARAARWWAPSREIFRRLVYKQGLLDGPAGWAFCFLSGLYEYVLAEKHERTWSAAVLGGKTTPSEATSSESEVIPSEVIPSKVIPSEARNPACHQTLRFAQGGPARLWKATPVADCPAIGPRSATEVASYKPAFSGPPE